MIKTRSPCGTGQRGGPGSTAAPAGVAGANPAVPGARVMMPTATNLSAGVPVPIVSVGKPLVATPSPAPLVPVVVCSHELNSLDSPLMVN